MLVVAPYYNKPGPEGLSGISRRSRRPRTGRSSSIRSRAAAASKSAFRSWNACAPSTTRALDQGSGRLGPPRRPAEEAPRRDIAVLSGDDSLALLSWRPCRGRDQRGLEPPRREVCRMVEGCRAAILAQRRIHRDSTPFQSDLHRVESVPSRGIERPGLSGRPRSASADRAVAGQPGGSCAGRWRAFRRTADRQAAHHPSCTGPAAGWARRWRTVCWISRIRHPCRCRCLGGSSGRGRVRRRDCRLHATAATRGSPSSPPSCSPVVLGRTGHEAAERQALLALAAKVPCVWAGNFSVGVNSSSPSPGGRPGPWARTTTRRSLKSTTGSRRTPPAGPRPGSSRSSWRSASSTSGRSPGQKGLLGPRSQSEVGIMPFAAETSSATTRSSSPGSASGSSDPSGKRPGDLRTGALRAAQWVAGQRPGVYDMQDVLGLK